MDPFAESPSRRVADGKFESASMLPLLVFFPTGCGHDNGSASLTLVEVSPKNLRLAIPEGDLRRTPVSLKNHTNDVVVVERIESTCDCSTMVPTPLVIPPNGSVAAEIVVDLRNERIVAREFTPRMKGIGGNRDEIFVISIAVTVEQPPESHQSAPLSQGDR